MFCLDIIQEIRAAHKLMEQTLESKLNTFSANKNETIVSGFYENILCCTTSNKYSVIL